MSNFKVGDRVSARSLERAQWRTPKCDKLEYVKQEKIVGTIVDIQDGVALIHVKPKGGPHEVYPFAFPLSACRRLVKKPRRRVWICEAEFARIENVITSRYRTKNPEARGWLEFIEVRKKKP